MTAHAFYSRIKSLQRRKKVFSVFRNQQRMKQGQAEARTTSHTHHMLHTDHFLFFWPIINNDDHPDPIFRWLYLGPQPRYKPSAASVLSPTPVAISGYPLIIHYQRGLLLCKPEIYPGTKPTFVCRPGTIQSLRLMPSLHSARPWLWCFGVSSVSICLVIDVFVCKKYY
jgi:hypothetical protein